MKRSFVLVLLLLASLCAVAQKAPASTAAAPGKPAAEAKDYSGEAVVIEQARSQVRFENDGTGTRMTSFRIRVKTEAGVQAFGILRFGYDSASERIAIDDISVLKPDGTVVRADTSSIQDLASPIQNQAPVYTDFREKHVNVPALKPGDLLQYTVHYQTTSPLAAGQFWYEYNFEKDSVTLDEQLDIDLPADRAVKIKWAPALQPKITEANGRRVYHWSQSQLEPSKAKRPLENIEEPDENKHADVQLTTFRDWAELAQWYYGLVRERAVATPEVQKAAADVVAGVKTEPEKIDALYGYVAKNVRYVSLSFGIGRLQPHSAADVLRNQYGDCKDKHTLLAAMLSTLGLNAYPVLIHTEHNVDPEIPSPAHFNHVITVVPQKDGTYLWFDATTEVAPPGMLMLQLRDKQALLVAPDGQGKLITTTKTTPRPTGEKITAEGKVDASGRLTLSVEMVSGSDEEVLLRQLFRQAPASKYPDMLKAMATAWSLSGSVSDTRVTDPLDTSQAFVMHMTVAVPSYLEVKSGAADFKLPFRGNLFGSAADPSSRQDPIDLRRYADQVTTVRITFPKGVKIQLPVPVELKRDYVEYRSSYRLEGESTVVFEESYHMLAKRIARSRYNDYNAFSRVVSADSEQTIKLTNMPSEGSGGSEVAGGDTSDELYDAAEAALRAGQVSRATGLLDQLLKKDPKHGRAWGLLGAVRAMLGDFEGAAQAYGKQIEIDPYAEEANGRLAIVDWQLGRFADAETAIRKQLEITPLEWRYHLLLADTLVREKKFKDAIEPAERASAQGLRDAAIGILVKAYVGAGQTPKAVSAIEDWLKDHTQATSYNDMAMMLADTDVELDRAERYARYALSQAYTDSQARPIDEPTDADVSNSSTIAAYWDTVGWVLFKKGDLKDAQRYMEASFWINQHAEVAKHLALLYEKQGEPQKAELAYAHAIHAATGGNTIFRSELRPDLVRLAGGDKQADALLAKTRLDLQELRSVKVKPPRRVTGMGEFWIVFGPGGKPQSVVNISGDAAIKALGETLQTTDSRVPFPDDAKLRLVRKGILSCTAGLPQCELVFEPPSASAEPGINLRPNE